MSNIYHALILEYPDDIALLRKLVPSLQRYNDYEIDRIYRAFSRSYCAQWLMFDEWLERFKEWLD